MKVICLTEGGKEAGYGHLTRCVAIAQAFQELSCQVEFILDASDDVCSLMENFSFKLSQWRNLIIPPTCDLIIVDSYRVSTNQIRAITKNKPALFIDDFSRIEYPRDGWILNACPGVPSEIYQKDTKVLAGIKYLPLRRNFWDIDSKKLRISSDVKEVFVMFGGADLKNLAPTTLNILIELFPEATVNLVQGKNSRSLKESFQISTSIENINIIVQPDISMLMRTMLRSDLAISAGGQTLQELARLGVPTVGVQVAENQKNNIAGWSDLGVIVPIINCEEKKDFKDELVKALLILKPSNERRSYSEKAAKLVDGQGARRVASHIMKSLKDNR
tara:strand:- start:2755 stop:3750 length:996 start_codon:yes stop_codon:yes gene_type:complete